MIRNIFPIVILAAILTSCGNKINKDAVSKTALTGNVTKVDFTSLVENPASYIDKKISVEGKVVHVCMHSGKKLFITGENPDIRLYIQAGEEMPKFPMELLGSNIVVEGTITKVASIPEGEAMSMAPDVQKQISSDTCETAKALASQPVLTDLMLVYERHEVK